MEEKEMGGRNDPRYFWMPTFDKNTCVRSIQRQRGVQASTIRKVMGRSLMRTQSQPLKAIRGMRCLPWTRAIKFVQVTPPARGDERARRRIHTPKGEIYSNWNSDNCALKRTVARFPLVDDVISLDDIGRVVAHNVSRRIDPMADTFT